MAQFPRQNRRGEFSGWIRTTHEDQPLLNPRARNDNGYALTTGALTTGMRLSVALVRPTGVDGLLLDTTGELSDFWQKTHRILTAIRKHRLGRLDTIWSSDCPQKTPYEAWSDVKQRIAELALRPVALGLCTHPRDYRGYFGHYHWGFEQTFLRPPFFSDRSELPAEVTLSLQPPPMAPDLPVEQLIAEVDALIEAGLPAARKRAARARLERQRGRHKRRSRERLPGFIGPSAEKHQKELDAWRRDHARATADLHHDPMTVFPMGCVRHRKLGIATDPFPHYTPPPLIIRPPPT